MAPYLINRDGVVRVGVYTSLLDIIGMTARSILGNLITPISSTVV